MSLSLILPVLLAALLHASWNSIVKGGQNKLYESAMNCLGGGLGALFLVPFVSFPAPEAWPLLCLSCLCHLTYYICISAAYKEMDLSVGYTIMRGTAPLLTALFMAIWGAPLTLLGWVGLLTICAGIGCLALGRRPPGRRGMFLALRTSVVIMGYTLADGFGAQHSGDSIGYACWIFVLNIFPLHALILWRNGADYLRYLRRRAVPGISGGVCGLASYGIAIWAMTQAPIALVAALRETSVIFGMLLGVAFLGESFSALRALAVVLVACGGMLLRLA